jgi:hypothetical protein
MSADPQIPQESPSDRVGPPHCGFLSLPVELRLEVYKHLIPDNVVPSGINRDVMPLSSYFRHDSKPICPAILSLNCQIYYEVFHMWYGTASFGMIMNRRWFYFLFATFDPFDKIEIKLPPNLRYICKLKIEVSLEWPRDMGSTEHHSKESWMKLVSDSLSSGPYLLRQVTLSTSYFNRKDMPKVISSFLNGGWKEFIKVLEWNLGAFRTLRGVELRLDTDRIKPFWVSPQNLYCRYLVIESGQAEEAAETALKKMQKIWVGYLRNLADSVSQNA